MKKSLIFCLGLVTLLACEQKEADYPDITVGPEALHAVVDKVTEIMIHDIFSPPVASRIFAYPNVAAYEIMAQDNPEYRSLSGQLNALTPIPSQDSVPSINTTLAALIAIWM